MSPVSAAAREDFVDKNKEMDEAAKVGLGFGAWDFGLRALGLSLGFRVP